MISVSEEAGLPPMLVALLDRQADGHALFVPRYGSAGEVVALTGVYMNPVGLALRGMSNAQVVGQDLLDRTRQQGNHTAADAYVTTALTGEPMHRHLLVDGLSGRRRAFEVSLVRVPTGDQDRPWLLSATFRDVTHELDGRRRLQRTAQDLNRLASTDPLTGLLNRRGWEPALLRAVTAGAKPGAAPFCVAIADLDRFKDYNDRHGHLAGDALLRELAARWMHVLSGGQVLARLGGEEFAVLLPDHDVPAASDHLDRLRAQVPSGQTVSIGLTQYLPGELAQNALGRADAALYAAKRGGRDRLVALLAPQ